VTKDKDGASHRDREKSLRQDRRPRESSLIGKKSELFQPPRRGPKSAGVKKPQSLTEGLRQGTGSARTLRAEENLAAGNRALTGKKSILRNLPPRKKDGDIEQPQKQKHGVVWGYSFTRKKAQPKKIILATEGKMAGEV